MKSIIPILSAIVLIFGLAFMSGCEKGEDVSVKKEETVKPSPLDEAAPSVDNDTSGELVSSDETDSPEIITNDDVPLSSDEQSGVIKMQNQEAVSQHRMGVVMFTHEKHYLEKPEGHGIGCGKCHHDAAGNPLTELKAGDPVQSCFECHNKKDRPRKPQDMSDEDWLSMRLEYYVEALHENCIECHKQQGGPVKCTDCHVKN